MGRRRITALGTLTLIAFPLVGFIIHYFFGEGSFWSIFTTQQNYFLEILVGMLVGTIGGLVGWQLIKSPLLNPVLKKYQGVIRSLNMNMYTIVFVSICAGVGEEILFRGVLQPFFGIWITAVVFVAIHGYLNPMDWRIMIYGSYMTCLIALLGWMNNALGLTSAMTAHTFIDIVLFFYLTKKEQQTSPPSLINTDFQINDNVE